MRRRVLAAALLGLVAFGTSVASALATTVASEWAAPAVHPRDVGQLIVISGRVEVAANESAANVIVLHGSATIDGDVRGDVVVFDGPVIVTGSVGDSVVGFNDFVTLTASAQVGGDVISRLAPSIAPGAVVEGDVKRTSAFRFWRFGLIARFAVWLAFTVSTLIVGLLLLALARRPLESAAIAARPAGRTLLWGLLVFVGLPIAAVLALVTFVGIPLGVSLLLALWFLFTVAYTVGAFALGRRLVRGTPERRFGAFFAGWGIVRGLALIPFLGGLVWILTTIAGLGAVAVASYRRSDLPESATVAPPPPPPAPVAR